MISKYGKVCPKHPDAHGRRYTPSNACIKCHNERTKANHQKRKLLMVELIEAASEARGYSGRLDAALKDLGYE